MKILIASRVGFLRLLLSQALEKEGHQTASADSPGHVLCHLRQACDIDVVLVDADMSGLSASELWRALSQVDRISDEGRSLPPYTVMLCHRSIRDRGDMQTILTKCRSGLGFGEILEKPIDYGLLCDRIRAIAKERLEHKQAFSRSQT